MKIRYFADTDTLYIVFSKKTPMETQDLDENTLLHLDEDGQLCRMTIEHAKERAGIPEVDYQQIAASGFFNYWRKRHVFISQLDLDEYTHEANVLIWSSLGALSNLWAKSIGKELYKGKGDRIIFDAFLAHYGCNCFSLVSLPDIWQRIDDGDIEIKVCKEKSSKKLPKAICDFLQTIGGRRAPNYLEDHKTRSVTDDLSMDTILKDVKEILKYHPEISFLEMKEWIALSRYGSIAYKQMRSSYIHEGKSGKKSHGFELLFAESQPTYLSHIYSIPARLGFSPKFMMRIFEICIISFENEALEKNINLASEV